MKSTITLMVCLLLLGMKAVSAQTGETLGFGYEFEGELRIYQLYVPADYDGSESWPLVLNTHGFGSTPGIQTFISQLNVIADTAHFLVAYPQGLLTAQPDGSTGLGMNTDWWMGRDDTGALSKLIDHVWTNYEVDLARVYATGLDNGGQMSLALACGLNDRIAAVGGVAVPFTVFQRDNCMPARPVPALLMHGTTDVLIPFDGVPNLLLSAPDLAANWADRNGCDATPEEMSLPDINTADSSTVTLKVYQNCQDGTETRLYEITNGGHTWSGGPPVPPGFEILGNVNRDVNTSVELARFFDRFSHPSPRAGTEVIEDATSSFQSRTMTVDGVERSYLLYVPADFSDGDEWPLVISMHGFTVYNTEHFVSTEMHSIADTAHFLIAYPQGLERASLGATGPGWNNGNGPDLADDVTFISNLIDELAAAFKIDRARVYATGMSQGGTMMYLLAHALPDRIAAIAPVAATMINPDSVTVAPGRSLPLLQIHGTEDGINPYFTEGSPDASVTLIPVPRTLDIWREINGCAEDSLVTELPDLDTTDLSTATRIAYENCADGGEVLHYRINGGGHTRPGSLTSQLAAGATNHDINASAEIWRFFSRHVHPDPLMDTGTASEVPSSLEALALMQNYPNPFRDHTSIHYTLGKSSHVHVAVYDLLGREVAVLVDGHQQTGRHEIRFNGSALPAGLYLYTLTHAGQIQTRKMMVLR